MRAHGYLKKNFFKEISWQKKAPTAFKTVAQTMNAQVLVFRQSLPAGKSAALRRDNEIVPLKRKDFQTKGCNKVIKLSASVLQTVVCGPRRAVAQLA